MREMGVFGLSIPEEYGGSAPAGHENTPMMIAVTEALSEASLAAAGSLITRPEILARALIAGGTEQQKAHWLPKLAAGDPLCAIAITEPDYGSDVASLSLKGTRDRRRLAAQRREDLVHVRRQGRRADGGRAHQPRPLARASRPERAAGREAVVRRPRVHLRAGGRRQAARPRDPHHRLPRHALVRPGVREFLRARRERDRRRGGPRQGLLPHDGRHGRRPHPDGGPRVAA